jgi:hypothetical protein
MQTFLDLRTQGNNSVPKTHTELRELLTQNPDTELLYIDGLTVEYFAHPNSPEASISDRIDATLKDTKVKFLIVGPTSESNVWDPDFRLKGRYIIMVKDPACFQDTITALDKDHYQIRPQGNTLTPADVTPQNYRLSTQPYTPPSLLSAIPASAPKRSSHTPQISRQRFYGAVLVCTLGFALLGFGIFGGLAYATGYMTLLSNLSLAAKGVIAAAAISASFGLSFFVANRVQNQPNNSHNVSHSNRSPA